MAKYADTEPSRRRPRIRRSTGSLQPDRRKSNPPARKRALRQQKTVGSRVRSDPQPAPERGRGNAEKRADERPHLSQPRKRKPKDPLERMVQTPYGVNQRQSATDAGVQPDALLNVQRLQQQIEENASLAIARFEGPGTCPHCRQTVHRPWHLQLGDPPIDLYFCNNALAELKYLVNQIKDPRKG